MQIKRTKIAFIQCTVDGCDYLSVDIELRPINNVAKRICPEHRAEIVEKLKAKFGTDQVIYMRSQIE